MTKCSLSARFPSRLSPFQVEIRQKAKNTKGIAERGGLTLKLVSGTHPPPLVLVHRYKCHDW